MSAKRKIFFGALILLTAALLFLPAAFANEIEIKPVLEGKEYYIMAPGEVQTFEALGFGWDKKVQQKIPGATVETVQWNFNPEFLELVGKTGNTITLRALKRRTSKLIVTGNVNGKPVTKTIFIVVKTDKGGNK
ncbi:MAG TPA: hypothetical protein PL155_04935 [Candidatus Omnitrophota bacterium]|nr:hypothetical protein [Candidatus Omnitrophota bacterium]HPD84176.1 hypothetical protein [Candidatus Omnitrophota bacterium]HRZ03033.1 hypothetical protein [Candidatus Omnitrophota bacterium]